jgi:hypothetical protein
LQFDPEPAAADKEEDSDGNNLSQL